MLKRVAAVANSAGGNFRVEASKLPKVTDEGVSYLRGWTLFNDLTITVGAGGQAVTPIQFHDLVANFEMRAGGEAYGPANLSGAELAFLNHILQGRSMGGNVSAESDENAADNAGAIERQVLEQFRYDKIGAEVGDFSPPVGYLAELGGALEVQFSAQPTNTTVFAGTTSVYAETEEVPELRAVPAIRATMHGVNALTGGSLPGGRLHALALKRTSDMTDSLVTLWQLFGDGRLISDMGDPSWINQLLGGDRNANAAAANSQESGLDTLGGTRPRWMQLYPHFNYDDDRRITKRAAANQFTYNLLATLTATEYEFLSLVSTRLTPNAVIDQAAPCGVCSRGELVDMINRNPAGATKPKTSSKVPTIAGRFAGWVPIKINVPSDKFGLRGR